MQSVRRRKERKCCHLHSSRMRVYVFSFSSRFLCVSLSLSNFAVDVCCVFVPRRPSCTPYFAADAAAPAAVGRAAIVALVRTVPATAGVRKLSAGKRRKERKVPEDLIGFAPQSILSLSLLSYSHLSPFSSHSWRRCGPLFALSSIHSIPFFLLSSSSSMR